MSMQNKILLLVIYTIKETQHIVCKDGKEKLGFQIIRSIFTDLVIQEMWLRII